MGAWGRLEMAAVSFGSGDGKERFMLDIAAFSCILGANCEYNTGLQQISQLEVNINKSNHSRSNLKAVMRGD